MFFPFRVKEYKQTKKGNGYMLNFENQYGQQIGYYVSNELYKKCLSIYTVGSIHKLNLYARNGSQGIELALDVTGLEADKALF